MADQKKQAKSGGAKKYGRCKDKCASYRAKHIREVNKIKRVLQSNGSEYAHVWARTNHVEDVLRKLIAKAG